jgi:hypothetical protein
MEADWYGQLEELPCQLCPNKYVQENCVRVNVWMCVWNMEPGQKW